MRLGYYKAAGTKDPFPALAWKSQVKPKGKTRIFEVSRYQISQFGPIQARAVYAK